MTPDPTLIAILSLLQRTAAPVSKQGLWGLSMRHFSNWPCRSANLRQSKPSPFPPETKPAVVGGDRQRTRQC